MSFAVPSALLGTRPAGQRQLRADFGALGLYTV